MKHPESLYIRIDFAENGYLVTAEGVDEKQYVELSLVAVAARVHTIVEARMEEMSS